MVVGDFRFYLKFWVKLTHLISKTATSNRYSLVVSQPSEKSSIITYGKSTYHTVSFLRKLSAEKLYGIYWPV